VIHQLAAGPDAFEALRDDFLSELDPGEYAKAFTEDIIRIY
jgi:hypothetical protein